MHSVKLDGETTDITTTHIQFKGETNGKSTNQSGMNMDKMNDLNRAKKGVNR